MRHLKAAIYVMLAMIPLHGLILKQTSRYFSSLERDKQQSKAELDSGHQAQVLQPACWAADFVRAAIADITALQQNTSPLKTRCPTSSAIEGLLVLCNKYRIEEDSTDVAWIYDTYSSQLQ